MTVVAALILPPLCRLIWRELVEAYRLALSTL